MKHKADFSPRSSERVFRWRPGRSSTRQRKEGVLEAAARETRAMAAKEVLVTFILFGLAIVSGVWTFEGVYLENMRTGGVSVVTVLYAALLALSVTAAHMIGWWLLLYVIPRLRSLRAAFAGAGLILMLQGWTFAVSTLSNLMALTGPSAILAELEDRRAELAEAVDAATARALAIKPFLGQFEGEAIGRCAQRDSELERGGLTGSGGRGAVVGTLDMLCAQSTGIFASIRDVVAETERRSGEVQFLLGDLDAAAHDHSRDIFERKSAFLQSAGEIQAWLRQTRADDLTKTLETAHRAMAASITTLPSEDGNFGSAQASVIEGLKSSIAETGHLYADLAGELADLPQPELPTLKRVDVVAAVLNRWRENLPAVAAAIGIDLFQLFTVLVFLLARDFTEPARPPKAAAPRRKRTSKSEV